MITTMIMNGASNGLGPSGIFSNGLGGDDGAICLGAEKIGLKGCGSWREEPEPGRNPILRWCCRNCASKGGLLLATKVI